MAVLMPTRRPVASISAPPEFPGLMAASVWMKFSKVLSPSWLRPVALTKRHLDGVGLPDDVVVGENVPPVTNDDTRTEAGFQTLARYLQPFAEQLAKQGVVQIGMRLFRDPFLAVDIDHGGSGCLHGPAVAHRAGDLSRGEMDQRLPFRFGSRTKPEQHRSRHHSHQSGL